MSSSDCVLFRGESYHWYLATLDTFSSLSLYIHIRLQYYFVLLLSAGKETGGKKKKKKTERKAKQRSSGSLEPCSELNSQCLIGANGMGVLRGWQTHSESQCTWFAYVSNVGRCLWLIRSEIDSAVLWSQQFLLPFVLYENDLLFCVRWMCVCVCEGEREIRCWDWNWILHGRHGRRKYSPVWGKKKKSTTVSRWAGKNYNNNFGNQKLHAESFFCSELE